MIDNGGRGHSDSGERKCRGIDDNPAEDGERERADLREAAQQQWLDTKRETTRYLRDGEREADHVRREIEQPSHGV